MVGFRTLHVAVLALLPVCMSLSSDVVGAMSTSIQVLSATIKDKPISGAEVIFQKNGQNSVVSRTNANGKAVATTRFGINESSVLLIIKATGYSTLIVKCPCDGMTYALSETMTQLDGMRIVLTWGDHPEDLDAHLIIKERNSFEHIYFNKKDGHYARLDVDSRIGWGPETITIDNRRNQFRYLYAVHAFSDHPHADVQPNKVEAVARVEVYVGGSLVKTYYFGPNKIDDLLLLFGIDERGEIFDINQVQKDVQGEDAVDRELKGRVVESSVAQHFGITFVNKDVKNGDVRVVDEAKDSRQDSRSIDNTTRLNHQGEDAYHRGDFETAIQMFKSAIDAKSDYAQAYSNLGLAYQKSGRIPEALWANRKAIATATGSTKHIVRASSFYNIGRMYEEKNDMESAMLNYGWAQQENPKQVYVDSLQRASKAKKRGLKVGP